MPRDENALGKLWDAIVEHTRGEELFWIGEILLSELEKETGYSKRGRRIPIGEIH